MENLVRNEILGLWPGLYVTDVCIDMHAHTYTQVSSSVYPRFFIYLDDMKDGIFIQQVPTLWLVFI